MARTIMAVGAHTLDAQLSCGMLLAKHALAGDRIITVDVTAGERGAPKEMTCAQFREINLEGAEKFAAALGGKSYNLGLPDGEVDPSKENGMRLAQIIRDEGVDTILCHWKQSQHRDHIASSKLATDAAFYAALDFPLKGDPVWVQKIYYAENWEDSEGFVPHVFFDVSDAFPLWKEAIKNLYFAEHAPHFRYLRYYEALSIVRGEVIRVDYASAFALPEEYNRILIKGLEY